MHQKPDQIEETRWEGQTFSEVVVPQEEEEEEEREEEEEEEVEEEEEEKEEVKCATVSSDELLWMGRWRVFGFHERRGDFFILQ